MWDWQKRKIEVTEHRLQDGCSGGGRQENLNVESIGPGQRRRDRITYELNGGAVISEMLWFETLRARNEAVTAGKSKIGTEVAAEFSGQRRVWHVCSSELGSSAKLSHLLWHLRRHLYVHSHPTLAEYRSPLRTFAKGSPDPEAWTPSAPSPHIWNMRPITVTMAGVTL